VFHGLWVSSVVTGKQGRLSAAAEYLSRCREPGEAASDSWGGWLGCVCGTGALHTACTARISYDTVQSTTIMMLHNAPATPQAKDL
jgi:hypothetical protein